MTRWLPLIGNCFWGLWIWAPNLKLQGFWLLIWGIRRSALKRRSLRIASVTRRNGFLKAKRKAKDGSKRWRSTKERNPVSWGEPFPMWSRGHHPDQLRSTDEFSHQPERVRVHHLSITCLLHYVWYQASFFCSRCPTTNWRRYAWIGNPNCRYLLSAEERSSCRCWCLSP